MRGVERTLGAAMTMRGVVRAIAGIGVLLWSGSAQAAEPAAATVEVTAQQRGRESLGFSLVLKNPKVLEVPLDCLPWGAYPNLQIVAIRTDDGTPLPKASPAKETVESPVTRLVGGRVLHGRVPLSEFVDDLDVALRSSDVVVFWTFRLDVPGDGHSNRTGGWVALLKDK
jgi:hypothetical protein